MTDQEKFDRLFASRGGLFDINSNEGNRLRIGPALQHCIDTVEGFIGDNYGISLPVPIINVVNNQGVGAVANVDNGQYFIGIYLGAFIVIETLFERMCASKHILKRFGEADGELETVKLGSPIMNQLMIQWNQDESRPIPVTKSRHYLTYVLAGFALSQLVMHEYAHIVHGHIDFRASK